MTPTSGRKVQKVLLLGPAPQSALQFWNSRNELYEVEHCTTPLSEAQMARKVQDVHIVCLRCDAQLG